VSKSVLYSNVLSSDANGKPKFEFVTRGPKTRAWSAHGAEPPHWETGIKLELGAFRTLLPPNAHVIERPIHPIFDPYIRNLTSQSFRQIGQARGAQGMRRADAVFCFTLLKQSQNPTIPQVAARAYRNFARACSLTV
jgi:hypothetical protein